LPIYDTPDQHPSIFGWSAALFNDMVIRESRDSEENQE
jgi:hypothetical protein